MCVLFSEECVTQVYTTFDASQLFCQARRLNHLDAMHVFPPTSRSCVVPRHGFLVLRPASWPRPNHLPPRATPAKESSPPAFSTHESKQTERRKNGAKHFKTEPKAGLQAVALPSIAARQNKRLPRARFRLMTCNRLLLLAPATPGNPAGVSSAPGQCACECVPIDFFLLTCTACRAVGLVLAVQNNVLAGRNFGLAAPCPPAHQSLAAGTCPAAVAVRERTASRDATWLSLPPAASALLPRLRRKLGSSALPCGSSSKSNGSAVAMPSPISPLSAHSQTFPLLFPTYKFFFFRGIGFPQACGGFPKREDWGPDARNCFTVG